MSNQAMKGIKSFKFRKGMIELQELDSDVLDAYYYMTRPEAREESFNDVLEQLVKGELHHG